MQLGRLGTVASTPHFEINCPLVHPSSIVNEGGLGQHLDINSIGLVRCRGVDPPVEVDKWQTVNMCPCLCQGGTVDSYLNPEASQLRLADGGELMQDL